MERENFYILLELAINPPEADPAKIEAAIAMKQSEWSRLRNHPSKGLQAQQYIGMIPEIQRVMNDPALRKQEAANALKLIEKDKSGKIVEIDRHIDILMGKGFVSREEIVKLAQRHDMEESEIQDRIRLKKDDKFAKVDQQLSLRMAKGYITEEEINKLAKRHNLKPEDVKSRVYIPMLKSDKTREMSPPRQMDKSLERSIKENLKIVDKASLYEFLEVHETTELEGLQTAALEKKKQLANLGKKDARVTAGNSLAGHCVTIFKSDESRIAYDISLAKSKLAQLDSDIDISGFNGKMRRVYYNILVQKAVDFGMEKVEAERYVTDYCKRKNWSIEQEQDKKRRLIIVGAIAVIVLAAAAAAGVIFLNFNHKQNLQQEYAALVSQVEASKDPVNASALLKQYITQNQGKKDYAEHVENARTRQEKFVLKIAEKHYAEMKTSVDAFFGNADVESARSRIDDYLKTNPPAIYAEKARKELSEIDILIEKNAFDTLSGIFIDGGTDAKIKAITSYIEEYPAGKNTVTVKGMLSDMSREYYIYVQNALEKAEASQNWQECADLASSYIDLFDNSHADTLKIERERYRQNIRQDRIFYALRQKARAFGEDYQQATEVYTDFLAAYRDTPLKERINDEIDRLKTLSVKAEKQRALEQMTGMVSRSGGRFVVQPGEVVSDRETGLIWTLLDSDNSVQGCMTFEEAASYVKSLTLGDYSDWRLPTAAEIGAIYRKKPAFPIPRKNWYWTADSYSGYSEGWYRIVDTIEVFPDREPLESRRDSRECGIVKAVRGN
jgi:hypothetical protein